MKEAIKKILIGLIILSLLWVIAYQLLLLMARANSPNGGRDAVYNPYYILPKPMVVKKIPLPKGTKLVYEFIYSEEKQLDKMPNNKHIESIELPEGQYINWGGMPVVRIYRFFNTEMKGYSIYPDPKPLEKMEKTEFTQLWERCYYDDLGISINNVEDWSFNKENISDITDCGQYSNDWGEGHRRFLDSMYIALKNANQPVELKKNP